MCRVDEADEWTFFHDQTRRARNQHHCDECGRKIERGEEYRYATGLMYDAWSVMKQCGQCHAASDWLVAVCRGFLYHTVLEDLEEHWHEDHLYRSLSFGRLILTSRERWLRRGELVPVEQVRAWVDDALARVPAKARW